MLKTPLKCPYNFISLDYLTHNLDNNQPIDCFALGSGALEYGLIQKNFDVTAFTNLYHVWEFWTLAIQEPHLLIGKAEFFNKNLDDKKLSFYRDHWYRKITDPLQRASFFYLLNRYSENGLFSESELTKHNFSKLNVITFERFIPVLQKLKLIYDNQTDFTNSFEHLNKDNILIIQMGSPKRKLLVSKEVRTPESYYLNYNKIYEYLDSKRQKVILLYKHNEVVEKIPFKKIYINKFGTRTENVDMAEDTIIANFDL